MLTRYSRAEVTWIDCVTPTPPEVRALMQEFGIDPSIAEELILPSYRPKVDRRGDVIYVVLHFPLLRTSHRHPGQETYLYPTGLNFPPRQHAGGTWCGRRALRAHSARFLRGAVLHSPAWLRELPAEQKVTLRTV